MISRVSNIYNEGNASIILHYIGIEHEQILVTFIMNVELKLEQ